MSGSINNVTLVGRLTRDPEAIDAGNYRKCRFTVACDRYSKTEENAADFVSCVAWGKTADFLAKYAEKGYLVGVTGSVRTGKYEKDGQKVFTTDINADRVQILETKKSRADYPNMGKSVTTQELAAEIDDIIPPVDPVDPNEDWPF